MKVINLDDAVGPIPADPQYTDWKLEAVAKALNNLPLDKSMELIISDLHGAVMGLRREVRGR